MNEVVLRIEVLDDDRLGGLERAAGRRSQIGGQGRRADDALLPAETGSDQQVGFPAAISEHFDMIDFHRPCDLHHDLVEKAVLIATFPRNPAHIDKNANMPPDFVQRRRLLFFRFLRHDRSVNVEAAGLCHGRRWHL